MRLIDADALILQFEDRLEGTKHFESLRTAYENGIKMIEEAPEIPYFKADNVIEKVFVKLFYLGYEKGLNDAGSENTGEFSPMQEVQGCLDE